ncbi:class I SAM-dependent methyltransferase [Halorarius halobius]|uniref:class I SAM-dependent methyltransferase n=1 Tax=Halorarius halobius TaxID=2962671 RepID=UPI0020CD6D3F|nr:class I SAM-dependent methyltransferase [Halorarius halobius]
MPDCTDSGPPGRCVTTDIEEVLDALPATARVLDAGCGQGVPMLTRANRSTTGIGLDIARAKLHRARTNVPIAPLVHGDMRRLPFRANTFDVVVAKHSIAHVPDRHRHSVFAEFARVLRPGGHLLLLVNDYDWGDASLLEERSNGGLEATRDRLATAGFSLRDDRPLHPQSDSDETAPVQFLRADAVE